MDEIKKLEPAKVFEYFSEISSIPRGSGNMNGISAYCENFAISHGLKYVRDAANNIVIFKEGTSGYENSDPVILQGHLDMVCQKDEGVTIDFERDGLDLYVDGDYLKARGTTLGADNGIAVAMTLAILDSDSIVHPPIEAVFTTDEEIGMIGAGKLDMSVLKGRRMINLDAEDPTTLTVSCAGGSDFLIKIPAERCTTHGTSITVTLRGLTGGHSGAEIHRGLVNASVLAGRVLSYLDDIVEYELISVNGGEKGNAIPVLSIIEIVVKNTACVRRLCEYLEIIKSEISDREPQFNYAVTVGREGDYRILTSEIRDAVRDTLVCAPNGVIEMSASIEGLVETSLNLGILKTDDDAVSILYTLRSNKQSALSYLEKRMTVFANTLPGTIVTSGHYPPWEYCGHSSLQPLYVETYREMFGVEPSIVAIHAGLECGIFASNLSGLDCIAIGTLNEDIHTPKERLSISSAKSTFELLLAMLKKMK